MADRARSSRKNIMREFVINELSAVDRPAQAHARAVIMKRDDGGVGKDVGKDYDSPAVVALATVGRKVRAMDFDEVVAEQGSREAAERVQSCVRTKWQALQRAFDSIAADESLAPADKVGAMRDSVGQFLDAVRAESEAIADAITKSLAAVPALAELLDQVGNEGDEPMTDAEKKQLAEMQKTVASLKAQLEAASADDPAKKAAELQDALDKVQIELADLTKKLETSEAEKASALAKAGMSDAEKEYLAGLSGEDKVKFMQASPADRKKMMAKAADADPIIYKAADGQEYRGSDDPRLVAMAKRADEMTKRADEERTARETAELTKRADDFLKAFAGDSAEKVEVLRAIAKMTDEPRKALEKMLEAGGKAIAAAFQTIGRASGELSKSAADFNKRVDEIQKRDNCSRVDAMSKARIEDPAAFEAMQASN